MKPIDQQIMHDPDNGIYGDCQRACVASLLDLPASKVPHFFESGDENKFDNAFHDFLKSKNLWQLVTGEVTFREDCYHMIYGKTERGTLHAVIAFCGEIVHDPHPSRAGLLESGRDNWIYAFLVPTFCTGQKLNQIDQWNASRGD